MGIKAKLDLLNIVFLIFASGMAQRASADSEPGSNKLPLTEEDLKMVKQNLCAPNLNSRPEKALMPEIEATACADCVKADLAQSTGVSADAAKVRELFIPLNEVEDRRRIQRDLAFFKSKYGQDYLEAEVSETEQPLEMQLKFAKKKLDNAIADQKRLLKLIEHSEKKSAVLASASAGQGLKKEEKDFLMNELKPRKSGLENQIGMATSSMEKLKAKMKTDPAAAEMYKESISTYESMLASADQELKVIQKALAGSTDSDVLQYFDETAKEVGAFKGYEDSLKLMTDQISKNKKRLAELKKAASDEKKKLTKAHAKKSKETPAAELQRLETMVIPSLDSIVTQNGFKTCGMTIAEVAMIYHYTGDGYADLNAALRNGGKAAEEARPAIEVLNSALKKLRRYRGPVMRGETVAQDVSRKYQVGEVITFPAYTSTSLTKAFGGSVNFIIHTKTGRYIGMHSRSQSEDEVLIPPGAKFKVIDRKMPNPHSVEFILDEIDPKIRPKSRAGKGE